MKRYVTLVLAVVIVAVVAWRLLSLTQLVETPLATLDYNDPLIQDARVYAETQNISLTEAVERVRLMQTMGDLQPRLEVAFPGTFAGLWIRHEPDFALVVQFTEDPGPALERYIEGEPYAHLVVLRVVDYSLVELVTTQEAVLHQMESLGLIVEGGIDISGNRVTLDTVDATLLKSTLAAEGVTLPEAVVVNQVEGMTPPETLYGQVMDLTLPDGRLLYFPQQPPTLAQMQALLEGELIEKDGCLRVATDYDDTSFLVLWPYDFAPQVGENGVIEVMDGDGQIVARVGAKVRLGGGAMESSASQSYYDDLIPGLPIEGCPGPYWVAGEVLP